MKTYKKDKQLNLNRRLFKEFFRLKFKNNFRYKNRVTIKIISIKVSIKVNKIVHQLLKSDINRSYKPFEEIAKARPRK